MSNVSDRFPKARPSAVVLEDADVVTPAGVGVGERFGYHDSGTGKVVVAASANVLSQEQVAAVGGVLVDASLEGVIRHEMGHQLYANMGATNRAEWEYTHRQNLDFVLSSVANQNEEEFFAEAFSYYTSSDYEVVEMPSGVSEFFVGLEGKASGDKRTKASTATEWLEESDDIDLEDVVFTTPYGNVSLGIATEYPDWLKREIKDRLEETFSQPYWDKINDTTLGDIRSYLQRGIRDGWSIERMAREMAPIMLEEGRYAMVRGRAIARTEAGHALNSGRAAAIDGLQADMPELAIERTWLSVLGDTTRETHANLDGVPADKNGEWRLGGVKVRWPSDVRLPPGERVNCQCLPAGNLVSGDFVGAQRGWYEGVVAEIVTRAGVRFTVTLNHPIMTADGWVRGGDIKPSNKLVTHSFKPHSFAASNDVQHEPASIENVFEAFSRSCLVPSGGVRSVQEAEVDDFYGDGKFLYGDVEIVRTDWELLKDVEIEGFKKSGDLVFVRASAGLVSEFGYRGFGHGLDGFGLTAAGLPSVVQAGRHGRVLIGHVCPSGFLRVGLVSDFDASLFEALQNNCKGRADVLSDGRPALTSQIPIDQIVGGCYASASARVFDSGCIALLDDVPDICEVSFQSAKVARDAPSNGNQTLAGFVAFDDVVDVRKYSFRGHVYDLQSTSGCIVTGYQTQQQQHIGAIVGNCTVLANFGMNEGTAQGLIDEYNDRLTEDGGKAFGKVFCPTGPGGGVDPTCGRGGNNRQDADRSAGGPRLWGEHYGSQLITGSAASIIGISGYRVGKLTATEQDEIDGYAKELLAEVHNDVIGSGEPLYHGFRNRSASKNVGDIVEIPLASSSGDLNISMGYGISYDEEDRIAKGAPRQWEPAVYEFPTGTPIAPYMKNSKEDAKYMGYLWPEAIVSGRFEVVGKRTATDPGYRKVPVQIYQLKLKQTYNPISGEWVSRT